MPRGGMMVMRRAPRRRMRGRGIMDFLKKAAGFLKKHKIVSRVASGLASVLPPQYASIASNVGKAAGAVGYGRRRRRMRGQGLRLAGM
jgi:hypothetical protein